jgi:O-antigen ligase
MKVSWLASFAALAFTNIGAAFALYIGSLAIFSPLHFDGWGSPLQRPDNCALVLFLSGMLFLFITRREVRPRFNMYVLAFLVFSVLHGILFPPTHFPALFRDVVVPLLTCELLAIIKLRKGELDALQIGLAVLGSYMGLVSILERIPGYSWILPPWVLNPSLRPFDLFLDQWIGSSRSGGTLLQPAWNGLLLSLIFCVLLLGLRRGGSWLMVMAMSLCVAGSFFTYTRGVWLGLALSLMWFPGWCRSIRQVYFRRAAIACMAVVLLVAAGGMAGERLQDSGTVYYRFNLWGAAVRLTVAHPLFGVGFFNFGSEMTGVEQGFGSVNLGRDVEEGVASHNTLLTVVVEFGVVGLLLYAMAAYKLFQRARSNIAQNWGRSGAAWVVAFTIVYLVNAQFVSAFEGTANITFFGFLGVIAGMQYREPRYVRTLVYA